RALSRAGRSFSRQMRLREIRRRTTEHLVLLLQQPHPLAQLAGLVGLRLRHARLRAGLDGRLADPILQAGLADPEIRRDLTQRNTGLAVRSDAHDVLTELTG